MLNSKQDAWNMKWQRFKRSRRVRGKQWMQLGGIHTNIYITYQSSLPTDKQNPCLMQDITLF
jgi:hypothetical protein